MKPHPLFVAALLGAPAVASARDRVDLRARSEVAGPYVALGEVASVEVEDLELRLRVAAVLLGPAPEAGEERRIPARLVRARLLHSGLDPELLVTGGAEAAAVHLRESPPEGEGGRAAVEAAIVEHLRRLFGDAPDEGLCIEVLDLDSGGIPIPAGAEVLSILPVGTLDRGGLQSVAVRVLARGKELRHQARARSRRTRCVVVARRDLPARQDVGPADLETRRVDLGQVPGDSFATPEEVQARRTRRNLARGEVLRARDLERVPLVERNAPVEVVLERGGVSIRHQARALEPGFLGERIRVRNDASRGAYTVTVTGPGQARAIPGATEASSP
ncbi:MAG: flagellar basal body P-ring formation protein FlgA [Planctomycetes bacterium]|nr:flagellar basal body P-ring formation protein FlgA [Planctomycetota bacterium]